MVGTLDQLLEESDPFSLDQEEYRDLKLKAFKESFKWHFENSEPFKRYCERHDFRPSDLKSYEDISRIPPVPANVFRKRSMELRSIPKEDIAVEATTSSTTSDNPITYFWNKESAERCRKGNALAFEKVLGFDNKSDFYFITPSPEETEVDMVKGMTGVVKEMGFTDDSIHYLIKGKGLDPEDAVKRIKEEENNVTLYGPPFTYLELSNYLHKSKEELDLNENARLLMTGGWKGVKGKVPRSKLFETVSDKFNVNQNQIRDNYGSTDIHGMLPQCEHHQDRFHVPPWDHVSVRDPDNLEEEVEEGEKGMVVLGNSLIKSYPAVAIAPGDMGVVYKGKCECGRVGERVALKGRSESQGERGCAIRLLQIEEYIEEITE